MNCKRARANIALWVGDDLDDSAERDLRRHVVDCPACHEYWHDMKTGLQILQDSQGRAKSTGKSLWPSLATALVPEHQYASRPSRFNGWVPAVAVAAACLAMISLANNARLPDDAGDGSPSMTLPISTRALLPPQDALPRFILDDELSFPNSVPPVGSRYDGRDPARLYEPRDRSVEAPRLNE